MTAFPLLLSASQNRPGAKYPSCPKVDVCRSCPLLTRSSSYISLKPGEKKPTKEHPFPPKNQNKNKFKKNPVTKNRHHSISIATRQECCFSLSLGLTSNRMLKAGEIRVKSDKPLLGHPSPSSQTSANVSIVFVPWQCLTSYNSEWGKMWFWNSLSLVFSAFPITEIIVFLPLPKPHSSWAWYKVRATKPRNSFPVGIFSKDGTKLL